MSFMKNFGGSGNQDIAISKAVKSADRIIKNSLGNTVQSSILANAQILTYKVPNPAPPFGEVKTTFKPQGAFCIHSEQTALNIPIVTELGPKFFRFAVVGPGMQPGNTYTFLVL